MQQSNQDVRAFLIAETFRFIDRIVTIPGLRRIAMVGSLINSKADLKDVDLLITMEDEVDLTTLATAARKLKGAAQTKNRGADIFIANPAGQYIGRICHWRDCGPGIRASCDAHNCGHRHYLHDDLDDINLDPHLVKEPPLEIWPTVVFRQSVASDLSPFLSKFEASRGEL